MADLTAQLINDYKNGRLIRLAQEKMVRGFNLTGLFPMKPVATKKVQVIDSTPIDKFVDQTGKQRKVAKGAKVRQIIGKVETTDGLTLTHNEIEYRIENEDLEDNPTFDIFAEVSAMAYVLAMDIESAVAASFRANAQLAVDSGVTIHANWNESTTALEHITDDVAEFEACSRLTPYQLSLFAQGNRANVEMIKRVGASVENYRLPTTDFDIDSVLQFMNARHFYGGRYMNDGEIFGIDPLNPGLTVFYKDYTNPNVKPAPLPQGMEKLAPPIRMIMFDTAETETEPQTVIKVANAVGAFPRRKGEGLFRYADVL